jgi:adiponectin receptor
MVGVQRKVIKLNLAPSDLNTNSDNVIQDSSRSPRSPRELWEKVKRKYHLVGFHALPDYLRDNEFILAGYRADWPLKQTLWSMFTLHNETLNIWT